ncbi:DUF4838 domain-containing protein [Paenibacillus eucommiae]|uniref:SLH domain-containing protein n=1 Tax=Paenibacillus eucommiae TaxID=1355755 RepID=A0ABS4J1Y0_9BACL|nr:DUF4838 domain-containing protein [Paenibacillus eucommiae]MBP1993844.1 hypothetical protein [Paenibacillus eucommiae]
MKVSKTSSKVLALLLSFCLIFSSLGMAAGSAAADPNVQTAADADVKADSDIGGHWAEVQLKKWLEAGLLQGYGNGQVAPDRQIARGELVALINRSFGFKEKAEIQFTDLSTSDWQYDEVSIAVKEGYLSGYEDGTVRVHNEISRQEAAVMLERILAPVLAGYADLKAEAAPVFTDAASIAAWSKAAVQQLADHKILGGYEDGSFKPLGSMTRAEAVTILDRALALTGGNKLSDRSFDQAGEYGSADQAQTITGNAAITAKGVTLRNMTITGDLLLAEGIGEGDVVLDQVTVKGATTLNGGGANSVHIRDSVLAAVIIKKNTGTVRIVLEGSTTTGIITVHSSVILEETTSSSTSGVTNVRITSELPSGSKVTLKGHFKQVDVEASNIIIEQMQGSIDKLIILAAAKGIELKTEKDAKILLLVLEAIVKVLGQGSIEKATVSEQAKGTTFEKQPKLLEGAGAPGSGSSSGSPSTNTPNPPATAEIASYSAVNGAITVLFRTIPYESPVISDFVVKQKINDAPETLVTASLISWSAADKKAVLTIPAIAAALEEQHVSYRISYKGSTAVNSSSFVVSGSIKIVGDRQAQAVVVVSAGASAQILDAADMLTEYVKKSTGADLPRITDQQLAANEQLYSSAIKIYLGISRSEDKALYTGMLKDMDDDGFVIDSKEENITIMGPTSYGTQYGIYEFLERYVGVRWLLPGPDGEDVPQTDNLYIPRGIVQEEPAIISRQMFGLHTPDFKFTTADNTLNYEWGIRNRMHDRISGYQHNMSYLFFPLKGYPAENYPTEHPEVYPMRNGERFIPTTEILWQPCFSEPIAVELAIGTVNAYFDAHPEQTSFSLAVNDGLGYCEAEPDHPKNPHKMNSIGYPYMSDIYYDWVNKVVEGVLEKHPDKWFGVLAYLEVNDPPSFQLNPRVIPYFTKDRMAWIDEGIRTKDQATIESWNKVSTHLAFYDYVYGTPYMVPRVYPHQMAEYLRYGKEHGVIAFFAELLQNWGEGPKAWLMAKLLWNPDQDVDVLLNDWYVRAVGEEAAADLKAYFDHWEQFWTERVKATDWFEDRKDITYLSYYWGTYMEAITDEEIAASRLLLESVMAKAKTPQQQARAEILLRQFEYYEASALSYPKNVQAPTDLQSALQLLEEGAKSQIKADYAQKRLDLIEQFKGDPLMEHSINPVNEGLLWSGWSPSVVWSLIEYIEQNEQQAAPVLARIAEMESSQDEAERNYAKLLRRIINAETLNLNSSFEAGTTTADNWDTWVLNYGDFKRVEQPENCYTGSACIYLNHFYYGDLSQTLPVKPGLIIAKMKYYVTKQTQTVGDTWLQMDLLDENGSVLSTFKSGQQAYSSSRGNWNEVSVMGYVPETVNGVAVKQVKVTNTVNGFHEQGAQMYMDDFEVYQSAEQDPPLPVVVSGVETADGALAVFFHENPDETPVVEDFTIVQQINGKATGAVPTAISWISEENKAVLTFPYVGGKVWEQNVAYSVTYKATAPVKSATLVLPAVTEGLEQIVQNASFEQWNSESDAVNWTFWGEGFTRSSATKRSGGYSLVADGLQGGQNEAGGGGPFQTVPITKAGDYAGVVRFNTMAATSGVLSWSIIMKDSDGGVVKRVTSAQRPVALSKGSWTPLEFEFKVDEGVTSLQFFVLMNDFKKGDTIYFDDVEIYRIAVPEPKNPISSVAAENGNLAVTFQTVPGQEPLAGDFTIERVINGATAEPVTPIGITWDVNHQTAALTIPALTQQVWEQHAVYSVRYKDAAAVKAAPILLSGDTEGLEQIMLNASFEQWNTVSEAANWGFWGEGFTRSDTIKRSGSHSLVADGLQPGQNDAGGGGAIQEVSVQAPGHYVGVVRFNTTVNTAGVVSWCVHSKDSSGEVVKNVCSDKRAASASEGNWIPFEFNFDVEEGVSSLRVFVLMNNFNKGDTIYFDDVELFKVQQ